MKKMISMLLVVCMLCALCVSAFAANITETGTKSQNTVVKYGMTSSYTVTIPETVAIDVNTLQGSTTVKASDVVLASGEKLNVILNGDCNANNEFYLEDTADASNTLAYTISNANGEALSDDDVVMTVDSGNVAGASAALKFALTSNVTKAGTYTDTLTFKVEIEANDVGEEDTKLTCSSCGQPTDALCPACGFCVERCCFCCPDCLSGINVCENGLCPKHCAEECEGNPDAGEECYNCGAILDNHGLCPNCDGSDEGTEGGAGGGDWGPGPGAGAGDPGDGDDDEGPHIPV